MKTIVRAADLKMDEWVIIDFLRRHHTSYSTMERYDWLYRKSPDGPARVWIAFDKASGLTVGMGAGFPRQVCISNNQCPGWVLGDFCIESRYRALGPALRLQRVCLAELGAGGVFYYDFPSTAMNAVYRRMGIVPDLKMARLVKVLRVNKRVHGLIKNHRVASALSGVVNTGLRLVDYGYELPNGVELGLHEGACTCEFTDLAQRVGSRGGACLWRSAEYLTWRYREHPHRRYEIIIMRRLGILTAYLIVAVEGSNLNVVDIFGMPENYDEMVRTLIGVAKIRNVETITAGVLTSHVFYRILRKAGFLERELFPIITSSAVPAQATPQSTRSWFLVNGDRES